MFARILIGISLGFLSTLMFITGSANAAPVAAFDELQQIEDLSVLAETAPNCRYGVFAEQEKFLTQLRFGWLLDFRSSPSFDVPDTIEYAHMIRLRQVKAADGTRLPDYTTSPNATQIAALVEANPGALWLIGNEPDRLRVQDDTHPKIYAMAFHDMNTLIKGIDPTAQLAVAGLVGVTPGRLQYLDIVWNEYDAMYGEPMPVDVWNFHDYIMSEVELNDISRDSYASVAIGTDRNIAILDSGHRTGNPDASLCSRDDIFCVAEHDSVEIFADMIIKMRQWMKDHGQQQKPLILTEFGLLYPYVGVGGDCNFKDEYGNCLTPQRAADFLQKTYEYMETAADPNLGYALDNNRLVQQWLWFSMPYKDEISNNHPGLMAKKDYSALTVVGQTHLAEVNNRPINRNLLVERADIALALPTANGHTATLSAVLRNNGNATVDQPVTVTFYADEARTQPIGSATIPAGVRGCARKPYTASVKWDTTLPAGWHSYWVAVDPGNAVAETTNDDNYGQGRVLVTSDNLFLPRMEQ